MKGFRFETFNVHAGNQTAFDLCRALAAQQYDGVRPVVLLGAESSGKSHLLWSIVNDVRARAVKTGLALIMPQEFPGKVRALIQDPQPILRGTPAILLVDGLEVFREDVADLEAVVRVFLENRQQVVLASGVLPDRLPSFSTAFKLMLNEGQMVELKPAPPEAESGDRVELDAARAELETVRAELTSARAELARLNEALEQAQADAGLRAEIDALRKQEEGAWRFRIGTLEQELEGVQRERDRLMEQSAADTEREKKLVALRGELEDARAEAESAFAEQARLQGMLGARKDLEEQLQHACAERDAAVAAAARFEELRGLFIARHSAIADQFEAFIRAFRAYRGGPDNTLWAALENERDEAKAEAQAFLLQAEQARRDFDAALTEAQAARDQAEERLEAAFAEQARLAAACKGAGERLKITAFELEKARRQNSLQTAEMDALRAEAVSQVATANIQAGEMELRIGRLEGALDTARAAGRAAEADAVRLSETLAQATETLRMLVKRQAALKGLDFALPPPAPLEEGQATLFESRPFEGLPAQFETLFRDGPASGPPGGKETS